MSTELKKLAEAVISLPKEDGTSEYAYTQYKRVLALQDFHAAASPDALLKLIAELDEANVTILKHTLGLLHSFGLSHEDLTNYYKKVYNDSRSSN